MVVGSLMTEARDPTPAGADSPVSHGI